MPEPIGGLHGIVLAAGGSTRLGRDKQCLEIEGETLIRMAVRRATAVCGSGVTVVLGPDRPRHTAQTKGFDVTVVENPEWRSGMSTSISAGLGDVPDSACGVLIVLVDQFEVTQDALHRLGLVWSQNPEKIAAGRYSSTLGAPAVFPRSTFAALEALTGDRGAKHVIRDCRKSVVAVDLPEAAADIDTPEDLARMQGSDHAGEP